MSVTVLLITHTSIGESFVDTIKKMFGHLPLETHVLAVSEHEDINAVVNSLQTLVKKLESEHEVLVLSDLFGSTPCNIISKVKHLKDRVRVVTGLNMPMLVRVMNYPNLPLNELVEKAKSGGRDGVIECDISNCCDEDS